MADIVPRDSSLGWNLPSPQSNWHVLSCWNHFAIKNIHDVPRWRERFLPFLYQNYSIQISLSQLEKKLHQIGIVDQSWISCCFYAVSISMLRNFLWKRIQRKFPKFMFKCSESTWTSIMPHALCLMLWKSMVKVKRNFGVFDIGIDKTLIDTGVIFLSPQPGGDLLQFICRYFIA